MASARKPSELKEFITEIDGIIEILKSQKDSRIDRKLLANIIPLLRKLPSKLIIKPSTSINKKMALIKNLEQLKIAMSVGKLISDSQKVELKTEASFGELLKESGMADPFKALTQFTKDICCKQLIDENKAFELARLYDTLQLDIVSKLDLSSIALQSSLTDALRLQVHTGLQMKHLVGEKKYALKKYLEKIPVHQLGLSKNPLFYEPLLNLLDLICFVPVEVFTLTIFLDKQKENFEKFLKLEANIPAVFNEMFHDLPSKKRRPILELIAETRKMVISYANNFYQLGSIIAQSAAGKISEAEFNEMKKKIIVLLIENTKKEVQLLSQVPELKLIAEVDAKLLLQSMDDPNLIIERNTYKFMASIWGAIKPSTMLEYVKQQGSQSQEVKASASLAPIKKKRKRPKKAKEKNEEAKAISEPIKEPSATPPVAVQSIALFQPESQAEDIKQLSSFADYKIPETKNEKLFQTSLSIQINANFYSIIQLMEKRKKSPNPESAKEAKYIRNALVHCKGLIDETLLIPNQNSEGLKLFHQEICQFSQKLVTHIKEPSKSELKACPFYCKMIEHGERLETELLSHQKQSISAFDRLSYMQWLGLQWTQYNLPEPLPVTDAMFECASKMLLGKFFTYGNFHFQSEIIRKLLAEKHGQKAVAPAELSELGRQVTIELRV